MHNTSFDVRFTVAGVFRWLAVAALSVSLVLFAAHAFAQGASSTHANATGLLNRADNGRNRIADDLNRVLNGQGTGHEHWVRQAIRRKGNSPRPHSLQLVPSATPTSTRPSFAASVETLDSFRPLSGSYARPSLESVHVSPRSGLRQTAEPCHSLAAAA